MFSKLNALKCQSNASESDGKREKPKGEETGEADEEENEDDVSDHMYEKLPSHDNRTCRCRSEKLKGTPPAKPSKISLAKRISKWRMECPGITNLRTTRSSDDREDDDEPRLGHSHNENSRNSHHDGKTRQISGLKSLQRSGPVRSKVMTVNVEREDGNLGITLRGGFHQNSDLSRPVVITYVKPDGPAARLGTIKPGDRLLAVDGISLQGSTLIDAQKLLKQPSATTLLTIEYNVNVLESVEHTNGPLLVEIEKSTTQQLGLTLFQTDGRVIIERVKPGSLADRCGALRVGDEILAVNSTRISGTSIALEDVMKVLECEYPIVRLEILPSYSGVCFPKCETWETRADTLDSTSSGMSTIKGTINRKNHRKGKPENGVKDYKASSLTSHGISGAEIALTHSETIHTALSRENGTFGLRFVDAADGTVLISSITPNGSAERSQCLHPGDRLLSINHRSVGLDNLKAQDVNDLLDGKSDDSGSYSKLSLHTEFDVLDTVVPSSGIFLVKLVKRGTAGLGITMTVSKTSGFIVSEMKKGSIAHRAGSLLPGDRLLAINNIPLDHCSVEYAAHIFHQSANIVTLKVQRDEVFSDFRNCHRKITYTVDLQRYGGPLGITIAGSEEPSHPITVSGLTAGGLAEQTGVIHIGDEILAINNHSLHGEPLSRAHLLLQNSADLVTLKLSRPLIPVYRLPNSTSPILPSSIDSAVESWDSSHLDLASSPDHQKALRDSHEREKRNASTGTSQQWTPTPSNSARLPSEVPDPVVCNSVPPQSSNLDNSDLAILDEITSENLKIKRELDLLSLKLNEQRKSKLGSSTDSGKAEHASPGERKNSGVETVFINANDRETDSCRDASDSGTSVVAVVDNLERDYKDRESIMTIDFEKFQMAYLPESRNWCTNQYLECDAPQGFIRSEFQTGELYEVTLYKDPIYEDFGFSVSDGLYERGVFINRIRKGGPADLSNVLKPYDRILQVNKTFTQDFDCCLTVPLIASAGDSLVLLVARNPSASQASEHDCFGHDRYRGTGTTMPAGQLDATPQDVRRILV